MARKNPVKKTTARIVVDQLNLIFCSNRFPTTIVTDNGPQFTCEIFKKYVKQKGINHVKSSPYHPQGNGVVERIPRTLTSVISRCINKMGNWAQVVPMSLYFLRCTHNRSAGISPFMLKHEWEPVTPLQLLYKGWVQDDLGSIDLEEWVTNNCERVQRLHNKAVVNLKECSSIRKEVWDTKAKMREFKKGDQVWMCKSGINTKLADSRLGPFKIVRRNSPLSYKVDTGDRVINSVHIQLLKQYVPRTETAEVKRVTTVLELDTESDSMEQQLLKRLSVGKLKQRVETET